MNIYRVIDRNIILINSHGLRDDESLSIYFYTTYKVNTRNDPHYENATHIKSTIQEKITDGLMTDTLQVTAETSMGTTCIYHNNLPPSKETIPPISRFPQACLKQYAILYYR